MTGYRYSLRSDYLNEWLNMWSGRSRPLVSRSVTRLR